MPRYEAYLFSSPLDYYTAHWKQQNVGQISYHLRTDLNADGARLFSKKNTMLADKFNVTERSFEFYVSSSFQEIMRLVGIDYSLGIIGKIRDGWGVVANKYIFSVMNNEDFSHDLFHFYSGTVHDRPITNWVTEGGVVYSWGNAYYTNEHTGEMTAQPELVKVLKEYITTHPDMELNKLFADNFWSDTSGIYDHLAPDYKTGRLISSLICDAVEEAKGMEGLNQLITWGNEPDRFTAFFTATEKFIGLNKDKFNVVVMKLLDEFGK